MNPHRFVRGFAWILVSLAASTAFAAEEEGWIPLFNGKNLDGWTVKVTGFQPGENPYDTFRVEDGLLKVSYDKYKSFDGHFGHIITDKPYSHYKLRMEYRFVGDQCTNGPGWAFRNSGAMIHSQPASSMRKDQEFPVSIEVQFLGGRESGERHTANVCTPGTHIVMDGQLITRHCTDSTSKTYRGDQWVTVEVEVHGGGVIKHIVDGQTVLQYEKPQLDPGDADAKSLIKNDDKILEGGHIALQAESHPVEFRKVELLPLKD
ncbi:MAG TPA: DUF1080 domain-containing protein [Isosphaeraceae bacterium]|nr:DUF1080 domain-containing protein [Isosphaeraceae bacterium]